MISLLQYPAEDANATVETNLPYIFTNIGLSNFRSYNSETSKQFDTEGPEEFHFMLVDILSKQKKSMIKLSNKLHIKNEGVDVNYLE